MTIEKNVKWALSLAFWCITAVLVANLGWTLYRNRQPFSVRAASRHPYTAVLTENAYDKSGALQFTHEFVHAERSDGSMMREITTNIEHRRTIYFANGDEVNINELIGKKSTHPREILGGPLLRDPAASCQSDGDIRAGWVVGGTEYVGQYRAVRRVLAKGERTFTVWNALDADCAPIQERFEHPDGVTVKNLTSLVLAEPDPVLFQVPATFAEVPPSGLYPPVCSDNGRCSSVPDAYKQRLDSKYYAEWGTAAPR